MRALSILLALTSLAFSRPEMARAAEPALTLRLASGREFSGAIDAESNGETLVLRSTSRGMTVRRPIRWERIAAAALDGKAVTIDELRALAKEAPAEVPSDPRLPTPASLLERTEDREQRTEGRGQEAVVPPFVPVTNIHFDARIANWDADVETDGLILDLMPIDAEGYLAPVSGVAEIELFALQRRAFHHAPLSGGDTLERVERWTAVINPSDLKTNGFRLKLPFGTVHPDFDTDWVASPYGLVHVRLTAPGHGTFDASQDAIRIRHFAPNRDQLELKRFPRFLPTESVGRHN